MLTGSPVVPFFSTRPRSSPARPLFQSSTLTESLEQATNIGFSSSSDVIPFDQIWYHLCQKTAKEKDISNDTQIRVIDSMEPELFTKMLRNLSEKLESKFRATGHCDSRVKIVRLVDATLDFQPFWESAGSGCSKPD